MVNSVAIPNKICPIKLHCSTLSGKTCKSFAYCNSIMINIASNWLTVLAFPQIFAAITTPLSTATKRIEDVYKRQPL